MNLESKIEAILLFKNEPVSFVELSKSLDASIDAVREAIKTLREMYSNRGIVIVVSDDKASFGTHPEASSLIEKLQKEEFSRDLGRAGLETLSIILYKGPVTRKEIDYIRGVNSSFIIRNLLIRGLVERTDADSRSFSYRPTLELLRFLGLSSREELPEFATAFQKLETFAKTETSEESI